MHEEKHNHLHENHPILRDYLAADRTILANERTLLAYIRTALTLLVVGASFIKFFDSFVLEILGWTFIPLAMAAGIVGFSRYERMGKFIHKMEKKNGFSEHPVR